VALTITTLNITIRTAIVLNVACSSGALSTVRSRKHTGIPAKIIGVLIGL
jgi:hypothetical protein